MKKFKYRTLVVDAKGLFGGKIDVSGFNNSLNEMGRDGWELVGTTASNEAAGRTVCFICVFKRELI